MECFVFLMSAKICLTYGSMYVKFLVELGGQLSPLAPLDSTLDC